MTLVEQHFEFWRLCDEKSSILNDEEYIAWLETPAIEAQMDEADRSWKKMNQEDIDEFRRLVTKFLETKS